jgi:hypothetical protein
VVGEDVRVGVAKEGVQEVEACVGQLVDRAGWTPGFRPVDSRPTPEVRTGCRR